MNTAVIKILSFVYKALSMLTPDILKVAMRLITKRKVEVNTSNLSVDYNGDNSLSVNVVVTIKMERSGNEQVDNLRLKRIENKIKNI